MLKVSLDQDDRDYIDQLNAFLLAALPPAHSLVDVDELTATVYERFGLRLPVAVVERGLRRLTKRGALMKADGIYTVSRDSADKEFNKRRAEAEENISRVVSSFRIFFEESFGSPLAEETAQNAIVSFVSRNAIECLRAYVFRTALPKMQHDTQLSYAFARFVNEAYNSRPELFKLVLVVFKGVMLANSFTCPDLESVKRNFAGVTFYLDTPLILSLLGLHGPNDQEKLQELVELVLALKGAICVFEHTLTEVDSVLAWCENALTRREVASRGRVVERLLQEGKTASDVLLVRGSIAQRLSAVGIKSMPTPSYVEEYQIDERQLEGVLDTEVGYPRERALHFDINSVRSIYSLRRGSKPRRMEEAKAVFVTSNSSFARAAYKFSRQYEFAREVSPVVTDYSLLNIAWLKSPVKAKDLPKRELMALCFAALEPNEAAWGKFLNVADSLYKDGSITGDDLEILRSDGHARQDAMDLTLGADHDFKTTDVKEVLARAKRRLTAEKDVDLKKKDESIAEYRRTVDSLIRQKEALLESFRLKGNRVKARSYKRVRVSLIIIWALILVLSTSLPFYVPADGALFWFLWTCLLIITLSPFVSSLIGKDVSEIIAERRSVSVHRAWLRKNGPDNQE